MQIARHHLRAHGFEQLPTEGFIGTMGRALGYDIEEMRQCIQEGRLGKELSERFAEAESLPTTAPVNQSQCAEVP